MTIREAKQNPHWQSWLTQAESAIIDNQPLNSFLAHCSPFNRTIARLAYNLQMISGCRIKFDIWWAENEPDSDSITARELAEMAFAAGFEASKTL